MKPVRVADRLCFGDESTCSHLHSDSLAIVHACKNPCHQRALSYQKSLVKSHPHYLVYESGHHLYLNLIDPPQPLFMIPSFTAFLEFVDRKIVDCDVLIHCNQGESRAPSLALLYMSKRLGTLPNESYDLAAQAFQFRFPYRPGKGIQTWLTRNWDSIK